MSFNGVHFTCNECRTSRQARPGGRQPRGWMNRDERPELPAGFDLSPRCKTLAKYGGSNVRCKGCGFMACRCDVGEKATPRRVEERPFCEAERSISRGKHWEPCGYRATGKRDGHHVCGVHQRMHDVRWQKGAGRANPHRRTSDFMRALGSV